MDPSGGARDMRPRVQTIASNGIIFEKFQPIGV